jgi:hypothetical protein
MRKYTIYYSNGVYSFDKPNGLYKAKHLTRRQIIRLPKAKKVNINTAGLRCPKYAETFK